MCCKLLRNSLSSYSRCLFVSLEVFRGCSLRSERARPRLGSVAAAVVMQNAYDMRRYKKSFAALVDAIDAAQRGDWRACVDSYELSFNLS